MPLDSNLAKPQPTSLAEDTYLKLLGMIQSGQLPRNSQLQERHLADMLGVSRTPVREALRRLENEGLAVRVARGQLMVKEPATREYIEILHVRTLLESEAAEIAARNLEMEKIDYLITMVQALQSAKERTREDQHRVDDLVHETIALATHNQHLAGLIRELRLKTRVFDLNLVPSRLSPGSQEHLEILEHLKRRDGEAAKQAMIRHLENVKQSIVDRLTQF
ncbi:GntR family transcriptional regulator [Paenalcaligenes niemegkensis]|uniref:GntR family transcriptional regulator n=1 Tax=Paenalcaligenes niemegkensis TaxID=2895469 RepID=UPI001EE93117|nr:GntR family transcriptional regulator [Paenalcaligenes niemegkensis]MCQ9618045.1 GntR family transcriptional regulator [Paenalcaligenes niemegkensis]